jgi:hypothetical protein
MYDSNNPNQLAKEAIRAQFQVVVEKFKMNRGMVFGVIIFGALLAFEMFNYTTTDFALSDLLGDLRFLGLRWAMILALAFCGMDFAGIARLFTPERERNAKLETWYLLGAWFLAATMNAMLTWWGVSIALLTHNSLGNEILSREQLLATVPVFVAVLVWLIRILMIGTFSMMGERLFHSATSETSERRSIVSERYAPERYAPRPVAPTSARPVAPPPRPAPPLSAQFLGAEDDDDFDQRHRPRVVDERPAPAATDVRRAPVNPAPPQRPAVPSQPIRPAPKPSGAFAPTGNNGTPRPPTRTEPPANNNNERY